MEDITKKNMTKKIKENDKRRRYELKSVESDMKKKENGMKRS
jgi:hypothetical protein